MKKILLVVSTKLICSLTSVKSKLESEGLDVAVNNADLEDSMRLKYLNIYNEPTTSFSSSTVYDKPKSKYHK